MIRLLLLTFEGHAFYFLLNAQQMTDLRSSRRSPFRLKALPALKGHTPCADPERGVGRGQDHPPPLKNHKGFLSNTGPDPIENHKATKPAFNVEPSSAHQRAYFAGGQVFAHL